MILKAFIAPLYRRRSRRLAAADFVVRAEKEYYLPPHFMHRAIEIERSRSDRTAGIFSLLVMKFVHDHRVELEPILKRRLRMSDLAGVLHDGRIALLLPDTPYAGACALADDLIQAFPVEWGEPDIEILVHPGDDLQDPGAHGDGWRSGELVTPASQVAMKDDEAGVAMNDGRLALAVPRRARPMSDTLVRRMPIWKRSLDITGALVGLTLSAPILITAAAAIKLTSPGPVFYWQERDGYRGRKFKMVKLRTMVTDAESQRETLAEQNELDGPAFKMVHDPRVTSVGRLLRRSSLDELPQFWNVLIGDMSLVGPRPLPTEESMLCERWQKVRLNAVPGLTCTWQVSGRSNISFDDWARMDVRYLREMSPINDLKLMARTIPAVAAQDGAY